MTPLIDVIAGSFRRGENDGIWRLLSSNEDAWVTSYSWFFEGIDVVEPDGLEKDDGSGRGLNSREHIKGGAMELKG